MPNTPPVSQGTDEPVVCQECGHGESDHTFLGCVQVLDEYDSQCRCHSTASHVLRTALLSARKERDEARAELLGKTDGLNRALVVIDGLKQDSARLDWLEKRGSVYGPWLTYECVHEFEWRAGNPVLNEVATFNRTTGEVKRVPLGDVPLRAAIDAAAAHLTPTSSEDGNDE